MLISLFDVHEMLPVEPNKDCSERHEGTIGEGLWNEGLGLAYETLDNRGKIEGKNHEKLDWERWG